MVSDAKSGHSKWQFERYTLMLIRAIIILVFKCLFTTAFHNKLMSLIANNTTIYNIHLERFESWVVITNALLN